MLLFTIGALLFLANSALAAIANFANPINGNYYEANSTIDVVLLVNPPITNQAVITQQCGTNVTVSQPISPVNSSYATIMTLPLDFFGTCNYTATFNPSVIDDPEPVDPIEFFETFNYNVSIDPSDIDGPEPISIYVRFPITFITPVAEPGYYMT